MTYKEQIIIDGVQFNKWGDFLIDYELNGIYKTISSSDKCYKILKSLIEQLKSKEQECKKLKSQIEIYSNMLESSSNKILKKEEECEELKKKCNIYTCGICGNKEDCNKLYKTLAEIKEIAKNRSNYPCSKCIKTEILQKISECEVNND